MSRDRGRRGVLLPPQETIAKLEKTANAGNFYEAQQMYKSITSRYAAAERYSEALDILQSGAFVQLKNGQITCGAELAVLFVETLVKGKFPFCEATVDRIRNIYKEFPQISVPQQLGDDDDMQKLSEALVAAKTRVESCSSFLKSAIKWSAEFGAHKRGSPELHAMLAEYIYSQSPELHLHPPKSKDFHFPSHDGIVFLLGDSITSIACTIRDMSKVSIHFVRGNNPEKFASTLVNFMGKCYPGEDDLAIARAVLIYLSQGNLRDANKLMDELKRQLKFNRLDFPQSDLVQFTLYLLQTLERDALPLFRILRQKYKSSIDRESLFDELLDEIGEKFYGVRRRGGMQGMFGDIFKMMGGEAMA